MNEWLQPQTYIDAIKRAFFLIVQWPVRTWSNAPIWLKGSVYGFLILLSILIIILVWKNKDKWMDKVF